METRNSIKFKNPQNQQRNPIKNPCNVAEVNNSVFIDLTESDSGFHSYEIDEKKEFEQTEMPEILNELFENDPMPDDYVFNADDLETSFVLDDLINNPTDLFYPNQVTANFTNSFINQSPYDFYNNIPNIQSVNNQFNNSIQPNYNCSQSINNIYQSLKDNFLPTNNSYQPNYQNMNNGYQTFDNNQYAPMNPNYQTINHGYQTIDNSEIYNSSFSHVIPNNFNFDSTAFIRNFNEPWNSLNGYSTGSYSSGLMTNENTNYQNQPLFKMQQTDIDANEDFFHSENIATKIPSGPLKRKFDSESSEFSDFDDGNVNWKSHCKKRRLESCCSEDFFEKSEPIKRTIRNTKELSLKVIKRNSKFYFELSSKQIEIITKVRDETNRSRIEMWQFFLFLLENKDAKQYDMGVQWLDKEKGAFLIKNTKKVAALWGIFQGNENTTYESMSRNLRHYYKNSILDKYIERRSYRFFPKYLRWLKSAEFAQTEI